MEQKHSIRRFQEDLEQVFSQRRYVVFLCGPRIDMAATDDAAALRARLKSELEAEGIEVVLGEDDGLETLRRQFNGMAHDNELQFIQSQSNTVILIAASVGSFCELGLFSHQHVRSNSRGTDFILIINKKYKGDASYLNEGPAKAIENFGYLVHGDFARFDTEQILERVRTHRHVWFTG